jgi:HEAT repeat protein
MRLFNKRKPGGNALPQNAGALIREDAVLALANASHDGDREAVVNRLTDALTHPVDRERCAAARALYRLGESRPLAEAVAILPADEGRARSIAARALVALRQPGTSATLAAALMHRDDERPLGQADTDLVATLIDAEADLGAAEAVIELAVLGLRHERSIVARRAEELLERLSPASLEMLVEELDSGSAPYRAAIILARMKDPRALEPLVAALGDFDPKVRSECCAALGELRDPAAAEPLLIATRDTEYDVRARASEALDRLGTAAIAVSVATLLRSLFESPPPSPHVLSLESNGIELPEGDDTLEWEQVPAELPPTHTAPEDSAPAENSTQPRGNDGGRNKGSPTESYSGSEVRESATSDAERPLSAPELE